MNLLRILIVWLFASSCYAQNFKQISTENNYKRDADTIKQDYALGRLKCLTHDITVNDAGYIIFDAGESDSIELYYAKKIKGSYIITNSARELTIDQSNEKFIVAIDNSNSCIRIYKRSKPSKRNTK